MKSSFLILLFFTLSQIVTAQSSGILVDEDFSDWDNVNLLHTDPTGDQGNTNVDFGKLWVTNDNEYLFVRIETGGEINLQNDNNITLYIDTDNNSGTGIPANGIGAELAYNFGDRQGEISFPGSTSTIYQDDIKLVSSPTVTSTEFEIAISRNVFFNGQALFPQNIIALALIDNENFNFDKLPNTGGITYTFNSSPNDSLPDFSFSEPNSQTLRVMSYNVLSDNIFDANLQAQFSRIFQATKPEIIGFQEVYNHSSADLAAKIESFLPSAPGEQWYHGGVAPDIIVVSRFPVTGVFPIPNSGNGAFTIDLRPTYDHDLFFFSAHPPCCANNTPRQAEIDAMMAFLRNAKAGQIGGLSLPANSPIIIVGDMNLVGFKEQQTTLLTGNILDNQTYGPDFTPDWDGSDLADAKPYTTGLPMTFTWYDENSSFSPGRLDYIVYSGSVLTLENSYSLFTPALDTDTLNAYSLQTNDVVGASDHLPLIADFSFESSTALDENLESKFQLAISPNPTSGKVLIQYQLTEKVAVKLGLYSMDGKEVMAFSSIPQTLGLNEAEADFSGLTNGVYLLRFMADNEVIIRRVVIGE